MLPESLSDNTNRNYESGMYRRRKNIELTVNVRETLAYKSSSPILLSLIRSSCT